MNTFVFSTSRGFSYSYIRVNPDPSLLKPFILFLHGFPSLALEWHNQIDRFADLGYGIIAPDLLGYGKTARPMDVVHYRFKDICQDIVEILDHENVHNLYGIAHDMGVGILSRLDFYFPGRLSKIVLLATGYHPPGAVLSLDAVNRTTKEQFGYSFLGYMQFFTEDPDAAQILNEHVSRAQPCRHSVEVIDFNQAESFFTLMYCRDPALWKEHLGPIGALKKWLLADVRADVGPWLSGAYRRARDEAFATCGGYQAPLNWYGCLVGNMNVQDEEALGWKNFESQTSTLLITAKKDPIVLPDMQLDTTRQLVKDLTVKQVDSGHWPMAERADDVSREILLFFESSCSDQSKQ